jgi:hypothetical protein
VRVGNFTNTSPDTTLTTLVSPGLGGTFPGGSVSQALPTPSPSPSVWSEFATSGQLSLGSCTPSPSRSGFGGGGGAFGAFTVNVASAGDASSVVP